jgi:hypothetical protein
MRLYHCFMLLWLFPLCVFFVRGKVTLLSTEVHTSLSFGWLLFLMYLPNGGHGAHLYGLTLNIEVE